MSDFSFLGNPLTKQWVILAPRRSKRPNISKGTETNICPFCPGGEEQEVFRVPSLRDTEEGAKKLQIDSGQIGRTAWQVLVVNNKYPFAPIHEIIIHSPDHHQNFGELPVGQITQILRTYKQRYNVHKDKGNVVIFHNHGETGGESLPHPHTQLAVIPYDVRLEISPRVEPEDPLKTDYFDIYCPRTAQWPDEVWIAPKRRGLFFGESEDEELTNLALCLQRIIQLLDIRHGHEFPYNFYIYPGNDWYLRIIPRLKILGGFEVATNVFVQSQDPFETEVFIKTHFDNPNFEKIESELQAVYAKAV
ncbi:MAG TPA: hypothetical protein VGT05_04290 [Patescibacteria group bacterium]|nr:hypothetical protein [Patescibacteria group bacterium]